MDISEKTNNIRKYLFFILYMSDSKPCLKHKGGAEKARAKNKKLLLESSAKCPKLTDMFKIKKD